MNETDRRALLEAVARGEVAPDEAARRLDPDDTEVDPAPPAPPEPPEPGREPVDDTLVAPRPHTVRSVRIDANAGSVRVIGDAAVSSVDVDGPHELREEGDTIVVRCSPLRDTIGDLDFDFPGAGRSFVIRSRHGRHAMRAGDLRRRVQVTVRVNPDLPLDASIAAGALSVRGMRAPIACDVDAGAARLHDVHGPLFASVSAGSLSVDGRLDTGESRISCDMGAASVRLDRRSDVRVKAGVNLGRCEIRLPDDVRPSGNGEFVLGSGRGSLDVEGSMSSVSITVD